MRGEGFEMVFDSTGGDNLPASFEAAKLSGGVITPASSRPYDLSVMHAKGLSLHVVFMLIPMLHNVGRERHGAILRRVATLVDEGILRPLLDPKRFTFAEVGAAHDYLEGGHAVGKVVLTW